MMRDYAQVFRWLFGSLAVAIGAAVLLAQQPQSTTAPDYAVSARYVQGVGTGYRPTAGAGLTLNIARGTVFCQGAVATYAGGTLAMANNTTNYVYLNTASSCVPATKTAVFVRKDIPVAVVVTASGVITTITDNRVPFVSPLTVASPLIIGSDGTISCPSCFAAATLDGDVFLAAPNTTLASNSYGLFGDVAVSGVGTRSTAVPISGWLRNTTIDLRTAEGDGALATAALVVDPDFGSSSVTQRSPSLQIWSNQAAGAWTTASDLVRVQRMDVVNFRLQSIEAGAGHAKVNAVSAEFVPETDYTLFGNYDNGACAGNNGATSYASFATFRGTPFSATEADWRLPLPFAGTFEAFSLGTQATQGATGSAVYALVLDGAAQAITTTVAASRAAGVFVDLANSVGATAGQTFDLQCTSNVTSGASALTTGFYLGYAPTAANHRAICGMIKEAAPATADYFMPRTYLSSTTEENVAIAMPRDYAFSNLKVNVSTAGSVDQTSVLTVMKGGVAQSMTATVTGTTVDVVSGTGTVSGSKNDTISVKWQKTAGTTGATATGWCLQMDSP